MTKTTPPPPPLCAICDCLDTNPGFKAGENNFQLQNMNLWNIIETRKQRKPQCELWAAVFSCDDSRAEVKRRDRTLKPRGHSHKVAISWAPPQPFSCPSALLQEPSTCTVQPALRRLLITQKKKTTAAFPQPSNINQQTTSSKVIECKTNGLMSPVVFSRHKPEKNKCTCLTVFVGVSQTSWSMESILYFQSPICHVITIT